MSSGDGWRDASRQEPCPICKGEDWCRLSADGEAALCGRASDAPDGWREVKPAKDGRKVYGRDDRRSQRNASNSTSRRAPPDGPVRNWTAEAERCQRLLKDDQLAKLASELGVLPNALRQIGVGVASADELRGIGAGGAGWKENYPRGAYTFPERSGDGHIVGLSLRAQDGRKGFPSGAKRGLIVPSQLEELSDPVLGPEGATDVSGLLTLGLAAVGRPSNTGGAEDLAELLHGREVLVVGERDEDPERPDRGWPGRDGAVLVAKRLARKWRAPVKWTLPPDGSKDVRSWLQTRIAAGLDLNDDAALRAAGEELLAALRDGAQEVRPPIAVRLKADKYGRHIGTLAIGADEDELTGEDVLFTGRLRIAEAADRAAWLAQAVDACASRAPWIGDPDSAAQRVADLLDETTREAAAEELTAEDENVRSVADAILQSLEDADLFSGAEDGRAYMTLRAGEAWRTFRVRSRAAETAVRRIYYQQTQHAPASEAVSAAINLLEARAMFEGPVRTVAVRVGHASDGAVWLDLAREGGEYVRVTRGWWEARTAAPDDEVRFVRPGGLQPLPLPERGGKLVAFRELLNVEDPGWALASAWIVYALWRKPYPVLVVLGSKGTGKSTFCRMLRRLVDPNVADLRSKPREERDLVISATNARIVALENLSGIAVELSDSLCRLATGAGFGTRELYTDGDETLFGGAAPVMVNGIGVLATRDDLLDRSLLLELEPIGEEERREESALWARYEELRPRLLGGLLDALAGAMRRLPTVQLDRLPRMADFARFAVAAEPELGLEEGAFLAAYEASRQSAAETALAESLIAEPLVALARKHGEWVGTTKELLAELVKLAGEAATKQKGWPGTPQGLRSALDRVAGELRAWHGIEITRDWEGRGRGRRRLVRVSNRAPQEPGAEGSPPGPEPGGDDGDDGDDPAGP